MMCWYSPSVTETHGVPPGIEELKSEFAGRIVCSLPCDPADRAAGVIILLSKRLVKSVSDNGSDDPRMAWVRIKSIYSLTICGTYLQP